MEISVTYDNVTTISRKHRHGIGFAISLTRRHNLTPSSPGHQRRHQIRAQILPIDAVAPPPVKPTKIPKARIRNRSRVRKRQKFDSFGADEGGNGGDFSGGGDGPFGGGGNDGNGGGFYGFNWDESSPFPSDPAFDFVYEVLSWFVLSNCLYFAFKRVVRIVIDGSADR